MQENLETQENDKSPLLKAKKPRAPQTEKQLANFKRMAEIRSANIQKRKEERLLEAQMALLAKNGIKVPIAKKEKVKEKQAIQFEVEEEEEQEEETEEEEKYVPPPPIKATPRAKPKQIKTVAERPKKVVQQIIEEDETDYSSDSSEEVIVIKRGKKKPKKLLQKQRQRQSQVDSEEEEYIAEPIMNYANFFC